MAISTNPKISVILPSFNEKKYINQCIESVINQTLEDIEIICVDAGSDDGTLEILKDYAKNDDRINVFLSDKKSYGSQVNHGISIAQGEYISIVETDDYIENNMLESLYELSQFAYADIVKTTFYHIYTQDDEIKTRVDNSKITIKNEFPFKLEDEPLFLEGHPSIWAAIYKRSFLINNDIKFMEEDGGAWVDNPFFLETSLKANNIIYNHTPYYYYRENNQESSSNNLQDLSIPSKRINDMFKILKDSNCSNQKIYEMIYQRLFRYIEITLENRDKLGVSLDYETCKSIKDSLENVDINFVRNNLTNQQKQIYYKYRSPLILSKYK